MGNEFTPKIYQEIRDRGYYTVIDDGSVQEELSRMLLKQTSLFIGKEQSNG